jgi:hypothetical protein
MSVPVRICIELLLAGGRAEEKHLTIVLGEQLGFLLVHSHSTNGIFGHFEVYLEGTMELVLFERCGYALANYSGIHKCSSESLAIPSNSRSEWVAPELLNSCNVGLTDRGASFRGREVTAEIIPL